ncbi:PRTRC system ThiF family protein [Polaromonas aquatica]|uniref:PRTRC system ThiF family protein n=1 Tax=Polaromonas aquatica TaxID=332657 RepID=A0ABW1TUA3_9BURK
MKHKLHANLLTKPVKVLLVGAGGTGSQMMVKLVNLHKAMVALGHPHGFRVTVVDPDVVSHANIGRQNFYPGDVGSFKADVLVTRANMALENTVWESNIGKLDTRSSLQDFDIVIGAVDNRAARLGILRGLEGTMSGVRYWLDTGNRKADGQVILGEVSSRSKVGEDKLRLPHVAELYPEMIDPAQEDKDDTPSCSLAEALEKQSLFINPTIADFAGNILWQLFTKGEIEAHGVFVNLERMMVMPMKVDPDVWTRFGVIRDGRRHRIVRESVKSKREAKAKLAVATA